jgi:hypothetical protein
MPYSGPITGQVVSALVQGPGALYYTSYPATEPADSAVNVAPPSANYTNAGFTSGGIQIVIDQTYAELGADQIVDSPGRRITKRETTIGTQMAQPTLENFQLAMNGGTVTLASSSAYKTFDPAGAITATQPNYNALCLDGWTPEGNGFNRRFLARKVLMTDKITIDYKKDTQTFLSVIWNLHYVDSTHSIFHIVDQLQ